MAYSVGGKSSSSSDNFTSTPVWKYDVFLSFAGKDTRLKFTNHLDEAFKRSGIKTFRDDIDLERGGNIIRNLSQAIEDSLCAVVVISKTYANSKWCLNELLKILESQKTLHRQVFPIFYDVDPSNVRKQTKSFGKAMAKHEKKFRETTTDVQNWRAALFEISNLSGWDTRGKHEADLIKNIVGAVWTYLCSKLPSYDSNLIGIDSKVLDMMSFLEIGLDDTRFVGIWGMGGVGKTTIARVVSEKISYKFEICCFLANVRETLQRKGIVSLQKRLLSHLKIKNREIADDYEGMKMIRKLLCNKKVLLVLDDLDDLSQLKKMAETPDWFGKGSRIIITTRDIQLLNSSIVVQRIYEMKTMKKYESLQLFSNKAFDKDHPEENYLELSESVVEYTGGLPLALEVLGSFLCGRSKAEWRDALDRLKQIPNNNILKVLKISYDVLNEEEKTIFLDIACFFKGCPKKEVTQMLKSCGLHATIGIKVLIEKTLLVETEEGRLEMHHLLEDLGKYIVRQESPNNVGNRSRLWMVEDIKEVLENNTGSEAIQAIVMQGHYRSPDTIKVHHEAFSKMSNIRLLFIDANSTIILPRRLKLSGALKVVWWPTFPFNALSLANPLDKLVYLQMNFSEINYLWNGIQLMKTLKFIDVSYSWFFTETPDFSRVPFLEHLCLRWCQTLVKVHPSLGQLKELVEVYLDHCENLEILPRKLETNSLVKLDLSGCIKVAVLPEFGEGMKKLSYLDVSDTSITRLPESLEFLTGLRFLNLNRCKILNLDRCKILKLDKLSKTHVTHPISGLNLTWLTELYLSVCGLNDESVPNDFGSLSSLIILDLSGNHFVNLPTGCFSSLFQLLFLSLSYCGKLKSLPRLPPRLIRLNASHCNSMEPLSSDRQLWNLVASLDHEHRVQTKYVISDEEYDIIPLEFKHIEAECLPLKDFCAIIPGREIPSWFPNKQCSPWYELGEESGIKANIPEYFRDSEWSGIVICFLISGFNRLVPWNSKDPKDGYHILSEWAYVGSHQTHHLCIMVLELNEETCWQHLRAPNNSLHIKLFPCYGEALECVSFRGEIFEFIECGWRVLSKEEIKEWCNLNDFNQVTQPQLATLDEVKLPWRVLNFIHKVDDEELLIEDIDESEEE